MRNQNESTKNKSSRGTSRVKDIEGQEREFIEKSEIKIILGHRLEHFADQDNANGKSFRNYLLNCLGDLITDLEIPFEISLTVMPSTELIDLPFPYFMITINGEKCRLPLHISVPEDVNPKTFASTVAHCIYQSPELLISSSLTVYVQKKWSSDINDEHFVEWPSDQLQQYLREFVLRSFRIDRGKELLYNFREDMKNWSARRIFEEAISDASLLTVKVFHAEDFSMHAGYGSSAISSIENNPQDDLFELARDGLFYELGIFLPIIVFEIDRSLEADEFRVQINDLRSPPLKCLRQGHFLVNDTVDRLSLLSIDGEPAINPANDSVCASVKNENDAEQICIAAGLTTWDPISYIILALSAEIRKNAGSFLTTGLVKHHTDQLHMAFPTLVDISFKRYDIIELTWILRELLDEEIHIRNLRGILEALLIDDFISPIEINDAVNSVRIALNQYISNKYTRGGNTIVVLLLSREIENTIENYYNPSFEISLDFHDNLIKALSNELADSPQGSFSCVILTTKVVRKRLREFIKKECLKLPVLCYEELSPDMNIQPIGRISLDKKITEGIT